MKPLARILTGFGISAAAAVLVAGTAAAAIPGPQRALCPQCFGLVAVGDDVFTDDPARAGEFASGIAAARTNDAAFFGAPLGARPRIVICTTEACDAEFGGGTKAKGATYGDVLIRFGPLLLTEPIFAHELLHAELAHGSGWFGLEHRFPAWFNEGLAVYVSKDTRYPGAASEAEVAWIKGAVTPQQWLKFAGGSTHAYEAARTAVGQIADRVGVDGLRRIVAEVKGGAPFEKALADAEAVSG